MARYRVGNSYLSEEEYEDHLSQEWKQKIFWVSALIVGFVCYFLTSNMEWPKYIRFGLIIISAFGSGYLLAKFSEIVRVVIFISIVGFIVLFIGGLIWESL